MIEINWRPSRKELRVFALLLMIFAAVVGAVVWRRSDSLAAAAVVTSAGWAIGLLGLWMPSFLRTIYVAWMIAVFPVGWLVSHVVVGVVYYLVLSPMGIFMRILGRDALHRKFDETASTYWELRDEPDGPRRYFRQF